MKIGIDIDDTLTNTKKEQIKYWKIYTKSNPHPTYTSKLPEHINEFSDEYIDTFWDTYRKELTFHNNFKFKSAKIIDKLIEDGHELCIITSRPDSKYDTLHQLLKDWFKLNKINITEYHTSVMDKGIYIKENNIDLLIDDSLKHINSAKKLNKKCILFNNIKDYYGLQTDNWTDLYKIIKELSK